MMYHKVEGTILYTDEWSNRYQRNNKRSGVKNLRCFPCCSEPHHMEKGYCGRPVTLALKRTPYLDQVEIFAWAEFKTADEIPRVRAGLTLSTAEVKSLTRSRIDIYKPWYRGDVVRTPEDRAKNDDIMVLFNTSKKGWNYNWAATRNSAMVKHVLICYVCTLDDYQEGMFRCIGTFESPPFTIYCRKQNGLPLSSIRRPLGSLQEGYDDDEDDDEADNNGVNQQAFRNIPPQFIQQQYGASDPLNKNQNYLLPQAYPLQQRQQQYPVNFEYLGEGAPLIDSKDEFGIRNSDGNDNYKNLFSSSSMSNLLLPAHIPSEQKYNQDSDGNPSGWMAGTSSSSSSSGGGRQISANSKKAPLISSGRVSFGDDDAWKKLLSPPSHTQSSNNLSWSSALGGSSNPALQNNYISSTNPSIAPTPTGPGYNSITGNKRRDMDSSSNIYASNSSNSNGNSDDDTERRIIRLCVLLDKLDAMVKEKGAASKMGVPQYALEEFLLEIGNVGFEDETSGGITPLSGSLVFNMSQIEPITYESDAKIDDSALKLEGSNDADATRLLEEFMGFLLNESQITASMKSFTSNRNNSKNSSPADDQERKMEFINVFHKQLETFLASKGVSFSDLDILLQVPKKDTALASKAIKKFEEHVRKYVEVEDTFEQRKRLRVAGPSNGAAIPYGNMSIIPNPSVKTIDLTGEWRLDDATLEALDSLRAIRNLPWFVRQVLTFMEKKIIVEHLPDRLLVRLNRKLLSTGCLEYLLDNQDHDLVSTGSTLPWARPVVETYRAWIDGDTFRFIHCYDSNLRSERAIKKNASGDRLEILVNLQERQVNSNGFSEEFQWKTIVEKTGYALRGPGQQQ